MTIWRVVSCKYHVVVTREADSDELAVDVGLQGLGGHLDIEPIIFGHGEDDTDGAVDGGVASRRFEQTSFRATASGLIKRLGGDELKINQVTHNSSLY